jgi:hypothetical protein
MSDYLARFQALTRKKADPELIRRWEWEARYHGDTQIKIELANAKRTATSMQKARSQFSNLKPEHELAINAAASALRALASELTPLAAWAKDYKVFCDAERKKEDHAVLEAIALKRWGHDERAVRFESELMRELGTHDGRLAFAAWCHSNGKHRDCKASEVSCTVDGLATEATERTSAARTVQRGQDRAFPNRWEGMRGATVICGWPDYEAYLDYRKEVAQTSARIVQMVADM